MRESTFQRWLRLVLAACACLGVVTNRAMASEARVLVVVLDGFRSDYFTPELMPRCYAMAQQGVIGTAHHSVLPTVTRVNASTLVTGCFASRHGLVANTLCVPELDSMKGISTGSRRNLLAAARVWGGRLLAVPTLAEMLERHGQKFLACSSGSSGSATLLNPAGAGAGILHPEFCVPESRTTHMYEVLGPQPPETEPAGPAMRWMTDAYLKIGVPEYNPGVTVLWFTDPDHTCHAKGIGAPQVVAGIRIIDEQLGRIFDFHSATGMKVNVFIVADHGFVTHGGKFDVAATLKAGGWMERVHPIVIDGAVYLPKKDVQHIAEMVRTLQGDPSIGPIFTAAKSRHDWKGAAPGTLSLDLAGGSHPHAAQIVAYPNWTAARNAAGYPGTVQAPGVAGHGATSPWEINTVFAAFGPDIKTGVRNGAPTSNVDLAPTIAFLSGIEVPEPMDGRVLREILKGGKNPDNLKVRRQKWTARSADGKYAVTLHASVAEGHRYVDEAKASHE